MRQGGAAGVHVPRGDGWLVNAGAAEHYDGVPDAVLTQQQFGLQVIDVQAQAARVVQVQDFADVLADGCVGSQLEQAGVTTRVMSAIDMLITGY